MNKIAPRRIVIFNSEVIMKRKSIVVLSSAAAVRFLVRLVDSSTHRHGLVGDPTVSEQPDVRHGLRLLVRWLPRRWDASAATLQFPRCARPDRRSCYDSTR